MDLADRQALVDALRREVDGEIGASPGARALYATDASNFRHVPLAVVTPRSTEAVAAAVEVCREHGAPVLPRGAGTSLAGQGCGPAVVVDTSHHLRRVLEVDPGRRVARVEPGVVLDQLRAATAPHGLTFGPDTSTHGHCTLGGMIGNNSCGVHALMAGTTQDNVEALDVLLADGTRFEARSHDAASLQHLVDAGGRVGALHAALRDLRDAHLGVLRTGLPDLPRRVSGFGLDRLLPERGTHVARALVGTEGTCALTLGATVRLVSEPGARSLVVLGFPDVAAAADAVPAVLEHRPIGLEGLDDLLLDVVRSGRLRADAAGLLPGSAPAGDGARGTDARGWLVVELAGEDAGAARAAAGRLADDARAHLTSLVRAVDDADEVRQVWAVREAALGTASRTRAGRPAWGGWEDSAVPPARLGDYLRDLSTLVDGHGYEGSWYGHFGEGCLHLRLDFDLITEPGVAAYRAFLSDAADVVVAHGGSLSGEHGDGQQRAELLDRMYPAEVVDAFAAFKDAFDPDGLLNPGAVVRPRRLDEDLRQQVTVGTPEPATFLGLPHDGGSWTLAQNRCVGVGRCRRPEVPDGQVMCPSYVATLDEAHSTRGRARLLWEALHGRLADDGFRSREVAYALDLCLGCKGCRSDCPVGVDMATYKAEFLAQHHRGRLRPRSHYALGWLPLWLRLARAVPHPLVRLTTAGRVAQLASRVAGLTATRPAPRPAARPLTSRLRGRVPVGRDRARTARPGLATDVVLFPDTFTQHLSPENGLAALEVLRDAGVEVRLPGGQVCCGLTWFHTGQLTTARRVLRRTLDVLRDDLRGGALVLGLEPSCTAALRSDALELLPDDPDARRLAAQTRTLAELLAEVAPDWEPPDLRGTRSDPSTPVEAVVQPHCHHHSVLGFDADEALLRRAGVAPRVLGGCCGVAGAFGYERGHEEVSVACAEQALLPAVRAAGEDALVLADGFSCRAQLEHLAPRGGEHLAQVLARGVRERGSTGPGSSTGRRRTLGRGRRRRGRCAGRTRRRSMTTTDTRRWTVEEFQAASERGEVGHRSELVDGEVWEHVAPGPRHADVVDTISEVLTEGARSAGLRCRPSSRWWRAPARSRSRTSRWCGGGRRATGRRTPRRRTACSRSRSPTPRCGRTPRARCRRTPRPGCPSCGSSTWSTTCWSATASRRAGLRAAGPADRRAAGTRGRARPRGRRRRPAAR